ncbi:GNAT family N-acetyltransferase [Actinoplanes siamensis]|uniref:Acetyltransferase n=1 Tax=Actinoplanes siamensis TaxID=1223317 RepID=A0A919NE41_9ACTN|nr:GNAT family N-acetyltransferase [Actinoplanes siamensis]GIF09044.1 acetyltransferase [Actinoplanes siamensis]
MTVILSAPGPGSALLLRPWRFEDLPTLVAAHQDSGLRRWLSTTLADEARAQQWLGEQAAGWAAATRFSFAVVTDVDDHSPLGHVAVTVGAADVAEVGYWTAAHARGQGVAPRALQTVSRWALRTQEIVPLTRLDLFHADDNQASCRVAIKCGYLLHDLLPAAPPAFPNSGHLHVHTAAGQAI